MKPDEWKRLALSHLEEFDDAVLHSRLNEAQGEENFSRFLDWADEWKAGRVLNPNIAVDQFNELIGKQSRKGKGGGRPAEPWRGERLTWQAAAAAKNLKAFWAAIRPPGGRKRAPVHIHDIVAEHYDLPRQQVDDYVRRGRKRWPEKTAPLPN